MIDPALHGRGWTEDLIRREETAGGIEIIEGPSLKYANRTHSTLQGLVNRNNQHTTMGLIDAKAKELPPTCGLMKVKPNDSLQELNIPHAFPSKGMGMGNQPSPMVQQIIPNLLFLIVRYLFKEEYELSLP